jgi:uracil-DNA glycosylase
MSQGSVNIIREQVTTCIKCDLCKTRTKAVPGKGNQNAEVIFIGEAPGRNEDKKGEPFVGIAGENLTIALEKAGISRDDVYITNVVKCRPPNNRVPTQDERDTCRHYLEEEMNLIKPTIICIMGNTAYNSILGGDNITKNRGKIIEKDGRNYFLTIHPAAVIYNRNLLPVFHEDIKKLSEILSEFKNKNK